MTPNKLQSQIDQIKKRGEDARCHSRSSEVAANIVLYTFLAVILLTLIGAWVKRFWLGWVFAGVGCGG